MYIYCLDDFKVGDRVLICERASLAGTGLPQHLKDGVLVVVGFTKKNVKCSKDGSTSAFSIAPELLELAE